jgi:[CysO sulfur-carrier protein]-S-L-cysteine hydrolase
MRLVLDGVLLARLTDYLRSRLPEEGCGFLIGRESNAVRFESVPNALGSRSAFEIHPAILFDLQRKLRSTGEDLVAICHSHPDGPARPSGRDIALARHPDSFYVIVSFASGEPEVRAWRIVGGRIWEAEVHANI